MFNQKMKNFYDANGYLVVSDVFDKREISRIRDQIDALLADPNNPPKGVTISREGNTLADKEKPTAHDDAMCRRRIPRALHPFFSRNSTTGQHPVLRTRCPRLRRAGLSRPSPV